MYRPLVDSVPVSGDRAAQAGAWGLRCIELHPGRPDDTIRCSLVPFAIKDVHGRYEALSYTWGDPGDTAGIVVDNSPFAATRNLAVALRCLRQHDRPRRLWVDSICINQADMAEVNTQVQRMWAIYEHALRVVVFLGVEESTQLGSQAFRLLAQLAQLHGEKAEATANAAITGLLDDETMAASWSALLQLVRRPWWWRAWIVQEYAVAKEVVFVCGGSGDSDGSNGNGSSLEIEMNGSVFGNALEALVRYRFSGHLPRRHEYLVRHVASTPIHHLWSTRCSYQAAKEKRDGDGNVQKNGDAPQQDALDLLYRFRASQSADPRDKVYSVYRLIAENARLRPDYGRSVQDLFLGVVVAMVESSGVLEVLCHHNRAVAGGVPGLPTWCPDWTVMRGKRILLWPNQYRTAAGVVAVVRGNVLTLRGTVVDRIQWLRPFVSEDFGNKQQVYRDIKSLEAKVMMQLGGGGGNTAPCASSASSADRPAPLRLADAFHRTLVAARIREKGPAGSAKVLGLWDGTPLYEAWSLAMEGKPANELWARWYEEALYSALCGRAFFVSEKGHIGLVDGAVAQAGSVVGIFAGSQVPFALHEKAATAEGNCQYEFVGECYLHGFMTEDSLGKADDRLVDIDIV